MQWEFSIACQDIIPARKESDAYSLARILTSSLPDPINFPKLLGAARVRKIFSLRDFMNLYSIVVYYEIKSELNFLHPNISHIVIIKKKEEIMSQLLNYNF